MQVVARSASREVRIRPEIAQAPCSVAVTPRLTWRTPWPHGRDFECCGSRDHRKAAVWRGTSRVAAGWNTGNEVGGWSPVPPRERTRCRISCQNAKRGRPLRVPRKRHCSIMFPVLLHRSLVVEWEKRLCVTMATRSTRQTQAPNQLPAWEEREGKRGRQHL